MIVKLEKEGQLSSEQVRALREVDIAGVVKIYNLAELSAATRSLVDMGLLSMKHLGDPVVRNTGLVRLTLTDIAQDFMIATDYMVMTYWPTWYKLRKMLAKSGDPNRLT